MFSDAGCHSASKGAGGHFECALLRLARLKRVKGQFENSGVIVHVSVLAD